MTRKGVRLTKKEIEGFAYEGKGQKARDIRWDKDLPSFGVRVYPSGRKAFVVFYRTKEGRQRFMAVGSFEVNRDIEEVRKRARKVLAAVEDGMDPLLERKQVSKGETVSELVSSFLEEYAEPKLKPRTVAEYKRQIETHVKPRWGSRLAKTIKSSEVAAFHSELGKRAPIQANRTLMMLASLFRFAKKCAFVPQDFVNPAKGVDKFPERKRDRWVRQGELPGLVEAMSAERNPYVRGALWLYLLVGARKSELLALRWDDVDETRKEVRFPDTKNGRTHYVALSDAALTVLRGLPKVAGNPYVLVGRKKGAHLVNVNKPWTAIRDRAALAAWRQDPELAALIERVKEDIFQRDVLRTTARKRRALTQAEQEKLRREPTSREILKATDVELPTCQLDVWIHDLRRTVGSWLASNGESLPLIGKVLNHSDVKTTAIYARLAEDPARRAMEEHGQRLTEVAGGFKP